jgi:hypothetical protein
MAKHKDANAQDNGSERSGGYVVGGNSATVPGEVPFKLNETKEIAGRFRGDYEVRFTLPTASPGLTVAQTLEVLGHGEFPVAFESVRQTLLSVAERFAPDADFAEVLIAKINGQGLRLDVQKTIKDYLSDTNAAHKELTLEEALAAATQVAADYRAGTPRAKGEGKSSKVAKAEARASAAVNTALDMYKNLDGALRAQYRPMLISGGMATAEELDEIDSATA